MKIVVFGSNGMLGTYCVKYFTREGFEVLAVDRNMLDLTSDGKIIYKFLCDNIKKEDIIINAAGVIKQRGVGGYDMISVNSLFPHMLSIFKRQVECKAIIHITTDCVFSGDDGEYREDSIHDCSDDYGKTKSLGEPNNLTIIRTSIIGEEINNKLSLIEWCKSMKDREVEGYTNHFWNGVTCLELCKQIHNLIKDGEFWEGVRHTFTMYYETKFSLVKKISDVFNLNLIVNPVIKNFCDRTLGSFHSTGIEKDVRIQLQELKEFNIYE